MMLALLMGCSPVAFTGDVDGYEPEFINAVYFEDKDDEVDTINILAVDFEDSCKTFADYLDASEEAFDELMEATTDNQERDALEEMNEAEEILPGRFWAAFLSVGVNSFGDGAVADLQLRGVDAEDNVESSGDIGGGFTYQLKRPDYVDCYYDNDSCGEGFDDYYADGGTGEITAYKPKESVSLTFETDFREWDAGDNEVGDRVGQGEIRVKAEYCRALQSALN